MVLVIDKSGVNTVPVNGATSTADQARLSRLSIDIDKTEFVFLRITAVEI
ncbi:MAG: hypothetical protein GPOALKHO_001107 [Sodalis sp.]|nr:MAG: hypothetical protein GPOALKHO_001107 [Sodalis sp.]